jgi:hypothetical protein
MSDRFGVTIVGAEQFYKNLADFGVRARQALAIGLREIGEDVMLQAKELCPVRYGALRASGMAQDVVDDGDALVETLSFGDTAVDYAIYVHEDLEAHHAVGQAKFLEEPLIEMQPQMADLLAESLRAQLGL